MGLGGGAVSTAGEGLTSKTIEFSFITRCPPQNTQNNATGKSSGPTIANEDIFSSNGAISARGLLKRWPRPCELPTSLGAM